MMSDIREAIGKLKQVRLKLPATATLPGDDLLNAYEAMLGIRLPNDYRFFLKEASDSLYNGRDCLRVTSDQSSPRELSAALQDAREMGIPESWIPFSEDNGDYYCFDENERVTYWSHDGIVNESWPDLAAWIEDVWLEEK